jgi:hypothetical protein
MEFGKNYNRASTEIFNTVNTMLAESEVKKHLNRLDKKLSKLLNKNATSAKNYEAEKESSGKEKPGWFSKLCAKLSGIWGSIWSKNESKISTKSSVAL